MRRPEQSRSPAGRAVEGDLAQAPVRSRKTASGLLLDRAIATLGAAELASVLEISQPDIERMVAEGLTMNLRQQRLLALAVLMLSEDHPDLRRRATALLGQVRASEEFQAGVTERHSDLPPLRW